MTLLSYAAADQPVLCAVDDAHWVDAESALALGFVDRVVADTARNALALVDIGSNHTAAELAAPAYLPRPIPVGRQLQDRYLNRVRRLPPEVQEFVLLVAADVSGERGRVALAAAAAGIDAEAAESAANAAGLVEVSGSKVGFRYPVIRAAVYHGAGDAERRGAHQWLSQASGSQGDADGQVWHRAAAAAGRDEKLAGDLEAAAGRARNRGASPARAMLLRAAGGRAPVVPAFTACRSAREAPSCYPGSIATTTPQAFTVASAPGAICRTRSRPPRSPRRPCTAPRPISARFEPAHRLRDVNTGSCSYAFSPR